MRVNRFGCWDQKLNKYSELFQKKYCINWSTAVVIFYQAGFLGRQHTVYAYPYFKHTIIYLCYFNQMVRCVAANAWIYLWKMLLLQVEKLLQADVILMQTFATIYRPFMKWLTLLFIFTSSWNNQLSKTQLQESPILLKQDSKTPSVARSTN